MHVIQRQVRQRGQRRMYLPSERGVVNGTGLGEVDGLFNIGKMFTRMFTFRPKSFTLKNIAGAIGSGTSFLATGGIANVVSEIAGPSGLKFTKGTITGAHSKPMQYLGYGVGAAVAATGLVFGGAALLPTAGGFFSTVGGALSTVGSGLMTGLKAVGGILPMAGGLLGGGGQQQQQGGMTQAEYDAQQAQAQQQAAYDAQVRAQQGQMYQSGYTPSIPFVQDQYSSPMIGQPGTMQTSYGDLRSPYTAIPEDGQQTLQIDPRTGQVIQASMIPDLSPTTWLVIGGTTLVGWYLMSGSKSDNQ